MGLGCLLPPVVQEATSLSSQAGSLHPSCLQCRLAFPSASFFYIYGTTIVLVAEVSDLSLGSYIFILFISSLAIIILRATTIP